MYAKRLIILVMLVAVGGLIAACTPAGGSEAVAGDQEAAGRAAGWLVSTHQNDDGGYASFSTGANTAPSDVVGTLDAVLALAVLGGDAVNPPLDFLRANVADLQALAAEDGAQAGKVVMALVAADVDPYEFDGHDYVADLQGHLQPSGDYGVADAYKQSSAILGLAAAGEPVPAEALAWLEERQAESGSWDDGFGTLDNPDATAMAVMALLAGGRGADDAAVARAVAFLDGAQTAGAGWGYAPGLPASANSTALVIQALAASGESWAGDDGAWAMDGRTPLDALLAFQGESGAFQADYGDGPFDDFFATVQSIPAAAGRSFPLMAGDGS